MATPLGIGPGPRRRGIPPLWRWGLVALLAVVVAMLLLASAFKRKPAAGPAGVVAMIERVDAPRAPAAPAERAESNSARIERQVAPGGGLIIKVPDGAGGMREAPVDARVAERTELGVLPAVHASGHKAYNLYARPFMANGKPMVAIVLTGVGVSARGTDLAIRTLPAEVTLAFAPYGRDLETAAAHARADGHEILLQVPMEPVDFPRSDPGPHTLRANDAKNENIARLHWLMSRFPGYVGLTNFMGSRVMRDSAAYGALLGEINRRGLMFLDDGTTRGALTEQLAKPLGLPAVVADRVLESDGRTSVDRMLEDAVRLAKEKGRAVVTVPALPAHVERIAAFAKAAPGQGVVLAPISAIMIRNAP